MDTAASLQTLGIRPVPIAVGLTRSGRDVRQKLVEARTLLRYILGAPPGIGLLRRYVRALPLTAETRPLRLAWWMRGCPTVIALFDQSLIRRRAAGAAFFKRLELAIALAEASPDHASRFIATEGAKDGGSAATRLAGLCGRLCLEAVVQVAVFPLRSVVARRLPALAE